MGTDRHSRGRPARLTRRGVGVNRFGVVETPDPWNEGWSLVRVNRSRKAARSRRCSDEAKAAGLSEETQSDRKGLTAGGTGSMGSGQGPTECISGPVTTRSVEVG